jgi:hypothetical protein
MVKTVFIIFTMEDSDKTAFSILGRGLPTHVTLDQKISALGNTNGKVLKEDVQEAAHRRFRPALAFMKYRVKTSAFSFLRFEIRSVASVQTRHPATAILEG